LKAYSSILVCSLIATGCVQPAPELRIPALTAKTTDDDEILYLFVADGSVQRVSSEEEQWIDVDEHPLIEVRERLAGSNSE
jgi:hypothetical protein